MASKEMYEWGAQASVIRDLFMYGQEQAAKIGAENVFDFSIGNPTVPAPPCIKEAVTEIMETREAVAVHGYTAAAGDPTVRKGLAEYMNNTYDAGVAADRPLQLFLMNAGITDTTAKARFDPDCTWKGNIRSRDRFGRGSFLFR